MGREPRQETRAQMMQAARHRTAEHARFEPLDPAEWDRLVRLCAHLSGSADAADDLAQETLIEAWRHASELRDPSAHRAWLSGIARNVCRRWRRRVAREVELQDRLQAREHLARAPVDPETPGLALEQAEMAVLLDRALGLLPDSTRDVLVLRYIDDLGNREIAARLGLDESAVAVRLHRGRAAFRKALAEPELRAEALDLGLVDADVIGWRESRVWCPFCGTHRLEVHIDPDAHAIVVRCAGRCFLDGTIIGGKRMLEQARALTSVKSILSRELLHLHELYAEAIDTGIGPCDRCGRLLPLKHWSPDDGGPWETGHHYGVWIACPTCGGDNGASMWHLLIDTPEAQRFWRRHPRMEALPVREIELEGRPALLSGFADARGDARLEIITARDRFELLHVDGVPGR